MSVQTNVELAQKIYEGFNKGDYDSCLALAAEDIEVVLTPFNQIFRGHSGFQEFMAGFKRAFPDITLTVINQVTTEDQIVNECVWSGTHTGPLLSPAGEIPPTGKTVSGAAICEVWGIRDGKLASLHNYQDVSSWLRQLGLVS